MFTMLLGSGFTRAYIDQPCTLRMPTEFKPKADVPKPHQLSQQELKDFYVNGFIGPFDCFNPTEMAGFKKEMLAMEKTKSKTYDFVTPRDRHFEAPGSFPFRLQRAQMTLDISHCPDEAMPIRPKLRIFSSKS